MEPISDACQLAAMRLPQRAGDGPRRRSAILALGAGRVIHCTSPMRLLLLAIISLVACDKRPSVRFAEMPTDCDTRTTPGPFDRGCTAMALGAVGLSGCLQDTAGGSGHLKIKFLPTGNVGETHVDSPGFAGTASARCVEERFTHAHIPPFQGAPVTVGKSFILE